MYVADTDNDRIQKFSATGSYRTQWATPHPEAVAVDPASGNVYVPTGASVRKYTSTGTLLTEWGTAGSGNGEFQDISGVAVDSSGNVYVADAGNGRIQTFTSTGTYLTQWATACNKGVAVHPTSGTVYVADGDFNGGGVSRFSSTGTLLTQWGTPGSGNGAFTYVGGIAVDPTSGNVYVTDSNYEGSAHRVQEFSPTGTYLTQWGHRGGANSQFIIPRGLAIGPNGNVYVADSFNNRIQRFTPP